MGFSEMWDDNRKGAGALPDDSHFPLFNHASWYNLPIQRKTASINKPNMKEGAVFSFSSNQCPT